MDHIFFSKPIFCVFCSQMIKVNFIVIFFTLLSFTRIHTHNTLSLSLTQTNTHLHSHTLSLSHILYLSLSHTHTHTNTRTHVLTHTHFSSFFSPVHTTKFSCRPLKATFLSSPVHSSSRKRQEDVELGCKEKEEETKHETYLEMIVD